MKFRRAAGSAMLKFLRSLRSLFSRQAGPPAAEESLPEQGEMTAAEPVTPKPWGPVGRPILCVGEDLAWLAGQKTLAGREVTLVAEGTEPAGLLTEQVYDILIAGYADPQRSLAVLRSAAAASPMTLGLLRANHKELNGAAVSYPVVPRVDSAEQLDDQLRTRLAAAAWQANPALTALLKKITKVPTLPGIYTEITAALRDPEVSINDIAALVAREPAVSAKLLQLANSPLLNLRSRVTSVRDATGLLGLSRLRSLVLATCLFRQFDAAECPGFSMAKLENSSLRIAHWASAIAREETQSAPLADTAFTAGLLHNFGMLLLAVNLPETYQQVLQDAAAQRVSVAWLELQTFGAPNSEIAGGILAAWGLPFPIVNAVGWSAVPSSSEDTEFTPLTAVHVALAAEMFTQTGLHVYDQAYMERLGYEGKLRQWCETLAAAGIAG